VGKKKKEDSFFMRGGGSRKGKKDSMLKKRGARFRRRTLTAQGKSILGEGGEKESLETAGEKGDKISFPLFFSPKR